MKHSDPIDQTIREGLDAYLSQIPTPDPEEALRDFYQRIGQRVRREKQARIKKGLRAVAAAAVLMVMVVYLSQPGHARFSWKESLIKLGTHIGVLRVADPSPPRASTPAPDATPELPFIPQFPTWLPQGSNLGKTDIQRDENSTQRLRVEYQSDSGSFSLLQYSLPPGSKSLDLPLGESKAVGIGDSEGLYSELGQGVSTLSFQKDSLCFLLKGQLTEDVAIKIARSIN